MKYEKHIGIIVPSSGIVTEMLFHQYAPRGIGVSTARVKFNQITFQSRFGDVFMYRHAMKAPDEMRQLHEQFYAYLAEIQSGRNQ